MNKATQQQMRERLEDDLSRMKEQVETIEREGYEALSEASGENNYRDHMADQGSATFDRELDMTLEENLRETLAAVQHAIARMDDDLYGVCERCSATIPDERLDAMPTATLCITCKAAEESR